MKNIIRNIKSVFFDTSCPLCKENKYDKEYEICYNCFTELMRQKELRNFENVYYSFNYSGGFRKMLLEYKNNNYGAYSKTIALLIKDDFFEVLFRENIDYIVPVPISSKRMRERGFNQVDEVLRLLKYRYKKARRIKNTKKMYKLLDENKRKINIKNSFDIDFNCRGKNVLVVDDIITTGSTVREFTKAIEKKGKAANIIYYSFALSKTGFKNRMRGVSDVT